MRMRSFINRLRREESGAAMVIVALSLIVLLSVASFAVDLGLVQYQRSKLQTAVDAATLAAVHDLPNTERAIETAKSYIEKNGFSADDVTIEFSDDNTVVRVSGKAEQRTLFANLFNIASVDNSASAAGKYENRSYIGVFDYRMFQGSDLPGDKLTLGAKYTINGSVHSNSGIWSYPDTGHITGNFEAVGDVDVYTPNISPLGGIIEGAEYIEMPDFSVAVDQVVPRSWDFVGSLDSYYAYLKTRYNIESWASVIPVYGNVKIIGDMDVGNWVIYGNLYIDGDASIGWAQIRLEGGSIYSTGDLTFDNSFYGNGCVFAKGDINFQGSMSHVNVTSSTVTIYSETGNINMGAAGTKIYGIVYAPNGNITIHGGTLEYYGSIVGKTITGIPANLVMGENDREYPYELSRKAAVLIE